MKRFTMIAVLFAFAVALCGCPTVVPTPTPAPITKDWTVTVTFSYDFTDFPICSSTVTVGCVNGFTWGYLQGTTVVPLKTSATTICTGTTNPKPCTDTTTALVGIGSVVPYVTANGVNNSGATIASASADGTAVTVTAGTPTNVGMTLQ